MSYFLRPARTSTNFAKPSAHLQKPLTTIAVQDPTVGDDAEKAAGGAPFLSWLVSDRALEPGHVDTLADIIKDQLFVNPLEYLEAEALSEVRP